MVRVRPTRISLPNRNDLSIRPLIRAEHVEGQGPLWLILNDYNHLMT